MFYGAKKHETWKFKKFENEDYSNVFSSNSHILTVFNLILIKVIFFISSLSFH